MARYLLLWVHGPWVAASLMALLALRLLLAEDFSLHGHGWGLLGSASICFSIGCVCKVSWVLAQLNRRRTAAEMSRSSVLLIIGIPWATAVALVLMVTKIHANSGRVHWGLLGSACICFSIGCLARTSVGLHDLAQAARREAAPPVPEQGAAK